MGTQANDRALSGVPQGDPSVCAAGRAMPSSWSSAFQENSSNPGAIPPPANLPLGCSALWGKVSKGPCRCAEVTGGWRELGEWQLSDLSAAMHYKYWGFKVIILNQRENVPSSRAGAKGICNVKELWANFYVLYDALLVCLGICKSHLCKSTQVFWLLPWLLQLLEWGTPPSLSHSFTDWLALSIICRVSKPGPSLALLEPSLTSSNRALLYYLFGVKDIAQLQKSWLKPSRNLRPVGACV